MLIRPMLIKLLVSDTANAGGVPVEHRFQQDCVTIGRAAENLLTLPDPKRIVSKQHAEIRNEGGTCRLVDHGSKNFTYLNGKRLRSGQPYDLQSGHVFEIGDFEIAFVQVEEGKERGPRSAEDKTAFAKDFSNPFDEPAARLVGALREIAEAYDQEAASRRLDALAEAFGQTEPVGGNPEAVALVGQLLGLQDGAGSAPETNDSALAARFWQEAEDEGAKGPRRSVEEPASPATKGTGQRRDVLFDLLLESVARLIRLPWQFRHEFIGQTIVQSSDHEALYEGSSEALKDFLMEASLSEEGSHERLQALREAVNKLVVHQMAMLDGYKAGVQNGAQQLLRDMNPEEQEKAVCEENKLYDFFPLFRRVATLEQLQKTYRELQDNDWSIAEQRIFRPAFIKAYLARMTTAPERT